MTEPSDEQIIADAMLLGVEFERRTTDAKLQWRGVLPDGKRTMPHVHRVRAAYWALHQLRYVHVGGKLTKLR